MVQLAMAQIWWLRKSMNDIFHGDYEQNMPARNGCDLESLDV
jgi:hypothetical protein